MIVSVEPYSVYFLLPHCLYLPKNTNPPHLYSAPALLGAKLNFQFVILSFMHTNVSLIQKFTKPSPFLPWDPMMKGKHLLLDT